MATRSRRAEIYPDRCVCGCSASADCDPAFVMLLSYALKPDDRETFSDLQRRADETALSTPRGPGALAAVAAMDSRRADYYKALSWRHARLPLRDLRPWPGMSGLPRDWCHGTIEDTAELIRREGMPASAERRLCSMVALADQYSRREVVSWLTRLPLIAVPDAVLHDRPAHTTAAWGLDEGCARSVALSLLGVKTAGVLVGEFRGVEGERNNL